MKTSEKIRAIMKARNLKQSELAEMLDVSQPTVARWLNGADPVFSRREALDAMFYEIYSVRPNTVPLMGYVGAGSEIDPDFEQIPPEGLDLIEVPFPLPDEMIAFVVRGESMLPVYKDGSVIICYREQKRPLEAFYGEEAAVRTSDGRRFIKTIMRSAGGVNLMSFNAAPIEDIKLVWIGEIFAVLPRRALTTVTKKGGIQGRLNLKMP